MKEMTRHLSVCTTGYTQTSKEHFILIRVDSSRISNNFNIIAFEKKTWSKDASSISYNRWRHSQVRGGARESVIVSLYK